MLGEIVSRRIALRTGALALVAGGLAACGATVSGASGTNIVTMTPAEVAAQASGVLAAVSGAVTVYLATSASGVTAAQIGQIHTAETAAAAGIASISTADVTTAASTAVSVANLIASIVTVIPGMPPAVVGAALAFQVLAAALEPVINGAAPVAAAALKPGAALAIKPGVTRVLLVPNS